MAKARIEEEKKAIAAARQVGWAVKKGIVRGTVAQHRGHDPLQRGPLESIFGERLFALRVIR